MEILTTRTTLFENDKNAKDILYRVRVLDGSKSIADLMSDSQELCDKIYLIVFDKENEIVKKSLINNEINDCDFENLSLPKFTKKLNKLEIVENCLSCKNEDNKPQTITIEKTYIVRF